MKIDTKRFLSPSIIDRCGLFDFKRRKQEDELILFLSRLNPEAVHIFYNFYRVSFVLLLKDHRWIEVAAEDVIDKYNENR